MAKTDLNRTRRVQSDEFYEPSARRLDFTEVELKVLDEWGCGFQASWTVRKHLGMALEEYWETARSIFRKLKLPRQSARQGTVSYACGIAVVLGILSQGSE